MKERGLTNRALAESAGLAVATVSYIRNGRACVLLPSLKKVADALGLDLVVRFEKRAA